VSSDEVLDVQVCAIKTRIKPKWQRGHDRLAKLSKRPFEKWPCPGGIENVDAFFPDEPFKELTACLQEMQESWEHHRTADFAVLRNVGKRHLLITACVQVERRKDGALIPLEHSPAASSVIWLKALGIMKLIGFDD
jgi:hypothetical protein